MNTIPNVNIIEKGKHIPEDAKNKSNTINQSLIIRFTLCNWYLLEYVWIMFTKGIKRDAQLPILFIQSHGEKLIYYFLRNYIQLLSHNWKTGNEYDVQTWAFLVYDDTSDRKKNISKKIEHKTQQYPTIDIKPNNIFLKIIA